MSRWIITADLQNPRKQLKTMKEDYLMPFSEAVLLDEVYLVYFTIPLSHCATATLIHGAFLNDYVNLNKSFLSLEKKTKNKSFLICRCLNDI